MEPGSSHRADTGRLDPVRIAAELAESARAVADEDEAIRLAPSSR